MPKKIEVCARIEGKVRFSFRSELGNGRVAEAPGGRRGVWSKQKERSIQNIPVVEAYQSSNHQALVLVVYARSVGGGQKSEVPKNIGVWCCWC